MHRRSCTSEDQSATFFKAKIFILPISVPRLSEALHRLFESKYSIVKIKSEDFYVRYRKITMGSIKHPP